MEKNHRTITFFYSDNVEKQTAEPIAKEALRRGYKVRFTDVLQEEADIGFYCQHLCFPENSNFSLVMLHDLGQGHNRWPDIWETEPWDQFDVGILPGKDWKQRWLSVCDRVHTRPRRGVFELGWPKADVLLSKNNTTAKQLGKDLKLCHPISILYAPSWENHGKQDEFVQALKDLPVNLLLKQAPWSDAYIEIKNNISEMNLLHRNYKDNIHVIDPDINIFDCLALTDVIVSDESSVLIEALLLNIPSVAVTDWLIPDYDPPRHASVPFDFVNKTTRQTLQETVVRIIEDLETYRSEVSGIQTEIFTYLGESSIKIMDVVDHFVVNKTISISAIEPGKEIRALSKKEQLSRMSRKLRIDAMVN
ncbi:MAG: hypothetical protein DSZ28_06850 [Thiothrix sp.]|nr:MAG: hypothetical protein DSZ28_06850 [Thiothrix sp.]